MTDTEDATRRRNAVAEYRKKLLQHKELESRVRSGSFFHSLSDSQRRLEFAMVFIYTVYSRCCHVPIG